MCKDVVRDRALHVYATLKVANGSGRDGCRRRGCDFIWLRSLDHPSESPLCSRHIRLVLEPEHCLLIVSGVADLCKGSLGCDRMVEMKTSVK